MGKSLTELKLAENSAKPLRLASMMSPNEIYSLHHEDGRSSVKEQGSNGGGLGTI